MNLRSLLLTPAACLALAGPAHAGPAPTFQAGLLTIPRVDTAGQPGAYQSARLQRLDDDSWRLLGVESAGTARLQAVRVDSAELIVGGGFPVSVLLRASGRQLGCGYDGAARVHTRMIGDRIEVAIHVRHTDAATEQIERGTIACTADVRPFKMTVPLPVYGLAAGSYTVAVNGVGRRLVLTLDNRFADDCDAGEAAERRQCVHGP